MYYYSILFVLGIYIIEHVIVHMVVWRGRAVGGLAQYDINICYINIL